ncbi:hypothetical protein [Candidatus Amarolinea dominans]|uniref:hypothetical protein n=1 Tax=Candidatus Amarolinea dominans TaxID=3140696 RepID=UPI001D22DD64|nr:hypothetical protein [Anaerolineae bacterium]
MTTGRSANDVTFQSQFSHSGAGSIARRLRRPGRRADGDAGATDCHACSTHGHATPVPPTPVPPTATPGKVETKKGEITSQALAGNLLGDPTTREFYVLLPSSYATSDKRYPVVYVLHWYTGHANTLLGVFKSAYQIALSAGGLQEMIFVFPDANNRLGGSMYSELADHWRLRDLSTPGLCRSH